MKILTHSQDYTKMTKIGMDGILSVPVAFNYPAVTFYYTLL